ncbi:ABC transporter permease [Amycolatopsis jejuensis]|uniref:ABC transporter permease n=1 Tax=Amycolatopsis jejuensis TaxID=330084 RepID=UPI000ABE3AD9|nr:ABC transporter permease [Amycolatopsis jejuensis]
MISPLRWWLRRAGLGAVVLWGAATLSFLGLHLVKGDPARVIAGTGVLSGASPQLLARISKEYGFDQPLIVQYGRFLGRLVTGDLGTSYQRNQPVSTVIAEQLGPTVSLAAGAAVLGFGLALALAVSTAGRPRARAIFSTLELALVSTPGFWIGMLLLTVFSFRLHWFPVLGNDGIGALILPWVTLALPIAGTLALVMRDGLERALDEPFALTVRARGATATKLRLRHALRHALLPVLTLSGWTLGTLLGGVVVVETVFARGGIGQVAVTAVTGRDLPVVTGVVLVATTAFVVINTGLDALYRVVDPRLREGPA